MLGLAEYYLLLNFLLANPTRSAHVARPDRPVSQPSQSLGLLTCPLFSLGLKHLALYLLGVCSFLDLASIPHN